MAIPGADVSHNDCARASDSLTVQVEDRKVQGTSYGQSENFNQSQSKIAFRAESESE
jgi:flagellar basal body P-ring protein FlgI